MAAAAILNLFESKIAPLDPPSPKTREPHPITRSDNRLRRYGHLKFVQDGGGRHLGFVLTGNSAIRSAVYYAPKTPSYNQTWSGSDDRLRRYGHLKFFQHGGVRHLRFVRTVNSAVRSAVPQNPTIEPNMKWIRSPVAEIWPFAYNGGIWNPHFGGKGRS